jgi:pyruvate dehydrogenase kinase 2/3/4
MAGQIARRSISSNVKKSAPQGVIQATNVNLHMNPSMMSATAPSVKKDKQQQQHQNNHPQQTSYSHPFSSSANLEVKLQKLEPARTVLHNENDLLVDMEELQKLANQPPTPLRLADMYKYAVMRDKGQRLRNSQFLHKELPIRIAQRAIDLLTLPHGLNEATPIRNVAHIYLRYLHLFENFPTPMSDTDEENFTEMLTGIMLDRTSIPMDIARGIHTWHDDRKEALDHAQTKEMEQALYRFFTARVGLRFLTEHHILSMENEKEEQKHRNHVLRRDHLSPSPYLGCIQTDCNPVDEVARVAKEVRRQTKDHYGGICPKIEIVNCSSSDNTHNNSFTYVPHHLQYMIAELLKNSCRATVRHHLANKLLNKKDNDENEMQPIRVVIVNGAEDVSIKIADRGGGVPRSTMQQIFKFAHSTADRDEDFSDFGAGELTGGHIRGFGLPLCRIYARYFGGELTLKSMEGYGLDAYLYLPRLGEACENMPLSVKASPGALVSMPTAKKQQLQRRTYGTLASSTVETSREDRLASESRRIMSDLQARAL